MVIVRCEGDEGLAWYGLCDAVHDPTVAFDLCIGLVSNTYHGSIRDTKEYLLDSSSSGKYPGRDSLARRCISRLTVL